MKNKNYFQPKKTIISVGMVSLITFFTILLLTSFSILILSSSHSDSRYTQMAADAIIAQYDVDAIAEQKLEDLYNIYTKTTHDNFTSELNGTDYTVIDTPEYIGTVVTYTVPVNDQKYYYIEIGFPSNPEEPIQRLAWQMITTSDSL